jgi:biotin carboxyl carrier protein
MDLTNEDVADVLALLDSLPYDELDLQTARFRLVLRRTPDGWTQSVQTRSAPNVLEPGPAAAAPTVPPGQPSPSGLPDPSGPPAAAPPSSPGPSIVTLAPQAAPVSESRLPEVLAPGTTEHRAGYNRTNVPSYRPGLEASGADEAEVATGVPAEEAEAGEAEAGEAEAGNGGADAGAGADVGASLVAVRAPLPGTFYRAPRPGAAPFVEVGSRVDPDTVVGIVETMKLMNSVTAGVAGEVAEICLGNAEFAAHGATLLRIRAD